ncbi:hypothetical protein CMI37_05195 [Candidatus Pacearchaeota archaeon]|jgi:ribosomal protein S25|nr:hypothetical protein [Candidatus Pacearchaeota archaeon]|tara:strand:- start:389 stop:625 length:237 start_codon:yes stop_codon:yes gene_type:complete
MDARDFKMRIGKYPKEVLRYLMRIRTRYVTIYHLQTSMKIEREEAKNIMYDLMEDGIIEKYQTTFRISLDFWKERSKI